MLGAHRDSGQPSRLRSGGAGRANQQLGGDGAGQVHGWLPESGPEHGPAGARRPMHSSSSVGTSLPPAGDRNAPATALGPRIYARWLGQRLAQRGRPALRLRPGGQEWVEGTGVPAATLVADPFELFRALSGRRSLDQVRALAWDGDPAPYLDLFAPYPMPASPLVE
jgi:hypothetical protein